MSFAPACGPWDGSALRQPEVCVRMETVPWDLVLLLWSETETTGRQGVTLQSRRRKTHHRRCHLGFTQQLSQRWLLVPLLSRAGAGRTDVADTIFVRESVPGKQYFHLTKFKASS